MELCINIYLQNIYALELCVIFMPRFMPSFMFIINLCIDNNIYALTSPGKFHRKAVLTLLSRNSTTKHHLHSLPAIPQQNIIYTPSP